MHVTPAKRTASQGGKPDIAPTGSQAALARSLVAFVGGPVAGRAAGVAACSGLELMHVVAQCRDVDVAREVTGKLVHEARDGIERFRSNRRHAANVGWNADAVKCDAAAVTVQLAPPLARRPASVIFMRV
jgi:hypothetical protein